MIDYQLYNLDKFRIFTAKILGKKFKGKMTYSETKAQVDLILSTDTAKLSGRAFYLVVRILDEDLKNTCKSFFKNHPASMLSSLKGSNNKLKNMFNQYLNSREELSKASGIKPTKLGSLFAEELEGIYACEVYGLAIATNKKPGELFEYFYGQ